MTDLPHLDPALIERFASIVGDKYALRDQADIVPYLTEQRGLWHGSTALVLRPGSVDEVSRIMRLASETGTPVVPQSGNTGLVGGQVPDKSGREIVLSLSRLNRIREVDVLSNTITAEAGVILQTLQEAADAADRLFPLSLAAQGSCQIGGNLSSNAGGTGVLAYGNARELCLGVEVVLPTGEVFDDLRKLKKDNTGYDLKDLFVGAETDFRFRLVPDRAILRLSELGERAFRSPPFRVWRQLDHFLDAFGHRNGAAAAGLGDPEGDAVLLNVVPDQADRLAETTAGIDKENRKPVGVLAAAPDRREQPPFFVPFQETNPSRPLLLAAEFGQAVDISHLMRLTQQFAEGSHLAIDGCVAVAALAQCTDKIVQGVLVKGAETLSEQDLVYFTDERADIVFMSPIIPEYISISCEKLPDPIRLYFSDLVICVVKLRILRRKERKMTRGLGLLNRFVRHL